MVETPVFLSEANIAGNGLLLVSLQAAYVWTFCLVLRLRMFELCDVLHLARGRAICCLWPVSSARGFKFFSWFPRLKLKGRSTHIVTSCAESACRIGHLD